MGAKNFHSISNLEDVEEAYRQLVKEAEDEYGTCKYNGTISTTDGYLVAQGPTEDVTQEEFDNYCIDQTLSQTEKWGVCVAFRYQGQWHFVGWAAE